MIKANPDLSLTLELWNMMENKTIAQAMEIVLPNIRTNRVIYIPVVDTILSRDNITNLPTYINQRPFQNVSENFENIKDIKCVPLFEQPENGYNC